VRPRPNRRVPGFGRHDQIGSLRSGRRAEAKVDQPLLARLQPEIGTGSKRRAVRGSTFHGNRVRRDSQLPCYPRKQRFTCPSFPTGPVTGSCPRRRPIRPQSHPALPTLQCCETGSKDTGDNAFRVRFVQQVTFNACGADSNYWRLPCDTFLTDGKRSVPAVWPEPPHARFWSW
jgi:hypothetical protein